MGRGSSSAGHSARDRSKPPKKETSNPFGGLAKAPPVSVNADAANEANRDMKAAKAARARKS